MHAMTKRIIFHTPFPLVSSSDRASQIRPCEMKKAFETLGYDVAVVSGTAAERKVSGSRVVQEIKKGTAFDFLYSESSTMPTLLTEPRHFPISPSIDFGLWREVQKAGIRIGIFYRDIYWNFPEYGKNLGKIKSIIATFFYRYDLRQYNRYADKVYLPSVAMQRHVPILSAERMQTLFPGHSREVVLPGKIQESNKLKLFYVGGVGSHYRLHKLIDVLSDLPQIQMTICTRQKEWEIAKSEFGLLPSNLTVLHKNSQQLDELFLETDINMLFFEPDAYREFAVPVKLFDFIGSGRPIIATRGTLAGDFVEKNNLGWSIPYDKDQLCELLMRLAIHRDEIREKALNVEKIASQHTWVARAKQVVAELSVR
jgi:glycosyltransferase involved in cell wall biosynthesis